MLRRSADDTDPVERVIVANAEQLVIVCALANPPPRPGSSTAAWWPPTTAGSDPLLCLTKADLAPADEMLAAYRPLGLPHVVLGRPLTAAVLDPVRHHLAGRISVLIGHSGVGKSTLVNALIPDADRAVGTVSPVTGRGRHTSSSAVALPLPGGGWIIDTPGLRGFGLGHVAPDRVVRAFRDLAPRHGRVPARVHPLRAGLRARRLGARPGQRPAPRGPARLAAQAAAQPRRTPTHSGAAAGARPAAVCRVAARGPEALPLRPMAGYDDDLRFAHVLADAADDITSRRFRALDLRVEAKPDLTPVTDADRATEESLRNVLRRARPRDAVLGEEFGRAGAGLRCWVIDPIDATMNYVRGVPVWATLIGLMDGAEVVVGVASAPALSRRWWAARDGGCWTGRSLTKATRCRVSSVARLADASLSYSSLSDWEERAGWRVPRSRPLGLAHPGLRRLLVARAGRRGRG